MTIAVKDLIWIKSLLKFLGIFENGKITLMEDNLTAIRILETQQNTSRSKHIDLRYKFCYQAVKEMEIKVTYVKSEENLADALTKPLGRVKFQKLSNRLIDFRGSVGEESLQQK